jgi:DNA polymerase III delta prime subunit
MPEFFRYGSSLHPENDNHVMVWREDLLRQLLLDIHNVDYPLIYGPRQIGKTTLALQLIHKLEKEHHPEYLPVFLECGTLAGSSSRVLAHKLECALLAELRRYVARSNSVWDIPNDPEGDEGDFYRSERIMQAIPHQLPKLKRLVLVIDEIECLDLKPLYETLSNFRGLFNAYHPAKTSFACCVVITCTRDLRRDLGFGGSPYNVAVPRYVPELTADEWRQKITAGCLTPVVSEEALNRLFHEVRGQPYLLQRVSKLAHDLAQSDGVEQVSERHVLNAIMTLFRMGDRLLGILGDAVDEMPERQDVVRQLLRGHKIPCKRILDSHNDLFELGLLGHSQNRLVFRNRLYRRVVMSRQYRNMDAPTEGEYLEELDKFLSEISEVQFAVMNHDLREEVFVYVQDQDCGHEPHKGGDLATIAKLCETAVNKTTNPVTRNLDIEFLSAALEYTTGKVVGDSDQVKSMSLQMIARLLAEAFICSIPIV